MEALRRHWPEYLMEAAGLGLFMMSACLFTAAIELPAGPVRPLVPDPALRRGLMGVAMGLTAAAIFYSPWGKQSGAHINPSVTLTFWRLGRVRSEDAVFYAAAQFAGALAGVLASRAILGAAIADPSVRYAATVPGPHGVAVAFAAELAISFGMMLTVLTVSSSRWARFTGLCAAALVALYITFEAPYSGMSMNAARTLGSALPAGSFAALWVYFAAPPLGMLAAAEAHRVRNAPSGCAKLHHDNPRRCIFCNREASGVRPAAAA